jgi:hypothetical protein
MDGWIEILIALKGKDSLTAISFFLLVQITPRALCAVEEYIRKGVLVFPIHVSHFTLLSSPSLSVQMFFGSYEMLYVYCFYMLCLHEGEPIWAHKLDN